MPWGFKEIRARAAPKGLAQSDLDVPAQVLWSRKPSQEDRKRNKFSMVGLTRRDTHGGRARVQS